MRAVAAAGSRLGCRRTPKPACGLYHRHRLVSTDVAALLATEQDDYKGLYCVGANVGRQLQDLKCLSAPELDVVLAGLRDVVLNTTPQLSNAQLKTFMPQGQAVLKAKADAAGASDVELGAAALTEAATVPGAHTTPSGLVFLELQPGDGVAPSAEDTVQVHYEGKLADGTVFDSSIARGEPVEFPLAGVIKGWTEGLQLMSVGGKSRLTMPPAIGYGDNATGPIPPRSTLIFGNFTRNLTSIHHFSEFFGEARTRVFLKAVACGLQRWSCLL